MNWVDGGEIKEETNRVRKESCEKKNDKEVQKGEAGGWEKISVRVKPNVRLRKKKEVKINKG